jgi:hypothetical protein
MVPLLLVIIILAPSTRVGHMQESQGVRLPCLLAAQHQEVALLASDTPQGADGLCCTLDHPQAGDSLGTLSLLIHEA